MVTSVVTFSVYSFTSAGFGDSTGAPVKQGTAIAYSSCTQSGCHTGNRVNDARGTFSISSNIPASGWVAGTTYRITLRNTFPGRDVYGWQATVWGNSDSTTIGQMKLVAGGRGQITRSVLRKSGVVYDTNLYFTHNSASAASPVVGSNEVSFDWVAPTFAGTNNAVTIYASANAANGNGNNLCDFIYLANVTYPAAQWLGVDSKLNKLDLKVYPNPAKDVVKLKGNFNEGEKLNITIFNLQGQTFNQLNVETDDQIDVSDLVAGTYLLRVTNAKGVVSTVPLQKQ